jgi:hypothetical protein
MVGRDATDAAAAAWLALAQAWRAAQLDELQGQLARVVAASGLPAAAPLVCAGCGAFLARALGTRIGRDCIDYARAAGAVRGETRGDAASAAWADVCAAAVAVALLAVER